MPSLENSQMYVKPSICYPKFYLSRIYRSACLDYNVQIINMLLVKILLYLRIMQCWQILLQFTVCSECVNNPTGCIAFIDTIKRKINFQWVFTDRYQIDGLNQCQLCTASWTQCEYNANNQSFRAHFYLYIKSEYTISMRLQPGYFLLILNMQVRCKSIFNL
ncbi:unnamed protein product [Paramecium pentaurelia]|uniref:Uncharacterized protein n=1 Tax=Paramecium pentaurelia TaxID=43138 RepID=A0A8S1YKK9_9CILI|nr:unnamed protein product [Paramecium pentaurelia]